MSLDNSLQSVPENREVIRNPGYARPETLLQELLALDEADIHTEKDQNEDSLEKMTSGKTIENISSEYQKILRTQSLSNEEPPEKGIQNIQRKEKSVDMVNNGHIGGMMDDLKSCEDFISFKNATVILLSQMNDKIEELNKRFNSHPTRPLVLH